ncbi:MAG: ABC transporter permease [Planctomycetota bacterium]|jgi:ABC-type dipeptide/oligopeptide/nickel transport system permease subunit
MAVEVDSRDRHPRHTAWKRFRRHTPAWAGAILLLILLLAGASALPFSIRWYNVQELHTAVRHPPSAAAIIPYDLYGSTLEGSPLSEVDGAWVRSVRKVAPLAHRASSWLGHDDLGRSLLFRLLPGFLVSLAIGIAAAVMAVVIGTGWGAVAAMAGGRVDSLMMRVVDVLYGLPYILMVILLKIALSRPLTAAFGGQSKYADVVILFLAIGGVSWLTMARVIRGQMLSLREQPFIEAARAVGAGPWYILWRHLIPNLVGPITVYATLVVPQAILQESFLSFLGIGVQQPYWWLLAFPCGLLVITLLALNFIGDGLRDAFDPKSTTAMLV